VRRWTLLRATSSARTARPVLRAFVARTVQRFAGDGAVEGVRGSPHGVSARRRSRACRPDSGRIRHGSVAHAAGGTASDSGISARSACANRADARSQCQLVKQNFISQTPSTPPMPRTGHKSPRWPQRRRNSSKSNSCLATRRACADHGLVSKRHVQPGKVTFDAR